ncbi:MAG: ABC-F family ATP-binding cassette domain-containing protein [Candidatus Babeliales bacterium]|nr:ABC-F family ATP-binding cassette domain-containing protein [Candidatus Babeliales bacterium]
MSHKVITINDISLYSHDHPCFEHFSTQIHADKHIVIMGSNGAGKSSLLRIVQGIDSPTHGKVSIPQDLTFGYVPQTVTDHPELSGGQRFNKALSHAISLDPDVLCLDEPTNHLDIKNKRSLIGMLQRYQGTLIIISHDPDILTLDFDEIWHIDQGKITMFYGNYTQYLVEHDIKQQTSIAQREQLQKGKREVRKAIQQEQKRVASSKIANKYENDKMLLSAMKASGDRTQGKNLKRLHGKQDKIQEKLAVNHIHDKIEPNFNLDAQKLSSSKAIVSITDGSCGYIQPILHDINLQILPTDRIAIIGDNGSGKSTFFKALLDDTSVTRQGDWIMPPQKAIGHLDQHYSNLNPALTVTEVIQEAAPDWDDRQVRKHLNDYLFHKPGQVTKKVSVLSGGEKARLSLAQIATQQPYLLLLDEITNNVDIETREHIIDVLSVYPGAMIIISHDQDFLQALEIETIYHIHNGTLTFSFL